MIKNLSCTLGLIFLILPGWAFGQTGLSLDHVDGLYGTSADTLEVNVPVMFHIRLANNSGMAVVGYTNGFRVYSSTGAQWVTTIPDSTGTITGGMTEQQFINEFSVDGAGADTVGFGGFRLFAPGIPNGFDQVVWEIGIGPIDAQNHQLEICIDSSYYPPASTWLWSTTGENIFPAWDGPHCFTIFDPNAPVENSPPVLEGIGDQGVIEGNQLTFAVLASDPDGDIPVLSMASADLPAEAILTDNGDGSGSFDWTPGFFDEGVYSAVFFATDALDPALYDSQVVTITVADSNRAPFTIVLPFDPVLEGETLYVEALGIDPDSTLPIMTASLDGEDTLATNMTFTTEFDPATHSTKGTLTFTPDFTQGADPFQLYYMRFKVCDEQDPTLCTYSVPVQIQVFDVNRAPILDPVGDKSVLVGETLSFGVTASDPDGDSLWLGMTSPTLPSTAVFVDSGNGVGQFDWTPTDADVGSYQVLFDASDGDLTDFEPITIGVTRPGGGLTAEVAIEPDTIFSLYQFSIESVTGSIFLGNITSGQTVDDIVQSSLLINSAIAPNSVSILDSHEGFTGRVLEIVYPMATFIQSYELLWDYSDQLYTVSGSLIDQTPFEMSDIALFRGHISGDVNLDGRVDIADVTYLIDYIFQGGRPPRLPQVADVTGEGEVDISDLTALIRTVFF